MAIPKKLSSLARRFKYVDENKFFYNSKNEYRRKTRIAVGWFLLEDRESGLTFFTFRWHRHEKHSFDDWVRYLTKETKSFKGRTLKPGLKLFAEDTIQNMIVARNLPGSLECVYLIGWSMITD